MTKLKMGEKQRVVREQKSGVFFEVHLPKWERNFPAPAFSEYTHQEFLGKLCKCTASNQLHLMCYFSFRLPNFPALASYCYIVCTGFISSGLQLFWLPEFNTANVT